MFRRFRDKRVLKTMNKGRRKHKPVTADGLSLPVPGQGDWQQAGTKPAQEGNKRRGGLHSPPTLSARSSRLQIFMGPGRGQGASVW
jgi:hypothetical protein